MLTEASKCIDGYRELAGRMILCAFHDLQSPDHYEEARAWFNGTDACLSFQHCAHMLDLDEEALRQFILHESDTN